MAKTVSRSIMLILLLGQTFVWSQSLPLEDLNILNEFKATSSAEGRFDFFYKTVNRYNENSAYDWLDAVTIFMRDAERAQDTIAQLYYQFLRSQIHYDLGDYDKSVELANDLFALDHGLDQDEIIRLLDLIDSNYAQLKLYEKQIEVRKIKRDLGITENIAFYDIYSNLGLHREAMNQYILDMKSQIDNSDLFGLAQYNNNIGRYLLMDKSASVALSNFKKAKGYVDIYLNDLNISGFINPIRCLSSTLLPVPLLPMMVAISPS